MHLAPKEVNYPSLSSGIVLIQFLVKERRFEGQQTDNVFLQLDKLVISQLGLLAQRRLARGVKLNHAEATVRFFPAYLLAGAAPPGLGAPSFGDMRALYLDLYAARVHICQQRRQKIPTAQLTCENCKNDRLS